MRLLRILVVLCAICVGIAAYVIFVPFGPDEAQMVVVPQHTRGFRVGEILEREGIIRSRLGWDVLRAWQMWRGGTLKAGEYKFDHPARMSEVFARVTRGDVYTVQVTVPEGYNIFDIAAAMERAGLTTREKFLDGARANVDLVKDLDPRAESLEGYLFPATYKFQPVQSVRDAQAAMVQEFRRHAAKIGLTQNFHDVVTLASLVERETPGPGERALVASVFENRLAKHIPLDTDPTVIYAALLEGRYRGTIYASDLGAASPYNTYKNAGLPPGPICNPGVISLEAAMRPAETDYLYFVSDNAGHSRFSSTLAEHNHNVELYRKATR